MLTIVDIDEADDYVAAQAAATSKPVLTTGALSDIQTILDKVQIAKEWVAETEYQLGDIVVPATQNGRQYRLINTDGVGFESGTAEPIWPRLRYGTVSDGNVTWQECGPAPEALWDLTWAIHLAWKLKAARSVACVDSTTDRQSFKASQTFDHCMKMAEAFAPIGIA